MNINLKIGARSSLFNFYSRMSLEDENIREDTQYALMNSVL